MNIADNDIADINKKRQILADAEAKADRLICYANLLIGAAIANSGKHDLWVIAAKIIHDAIAEGTEETANLQGQKWLAADQPDGAFDRTPLHWPLVFPEVFSGDSAVGPGWTPLSAILHSLRTHGIVGCCLPRIPCQLDRPRRPGRRRPDRLLPAPRTRASQSPRPDRPYRDQHSCPRRHARGRPRSDHRRRYRDKTGDQEQTSRRKAPSLNMLPSGQVSTPLLHLQNDWLTAPWLLGLHRHLTRPRACLVTQNGWPPTPLSRSRA